MNHQHQQPRLLNSKQVQQLYSISRATLHRRLNAGMLPRPIQINGNNFWNSTEVNQHIDELIGGNAKWKG